MARSLARKGLSNNANEYSWLNKINERGIMIDYFVQNGKKINLGAEIGQYKVWGLIDACYSPASYTSIIKTPKIHQLLRIFV